MNLPIFAALSLAEVLRHYYLIEHRHISPNKGFSLALRASVAIVLAYYDAVPFIYAIAAYGILDWWLHDYVLNLLRKVSPVWYLNDSGPIDRFQRQFPDMFLWFVWKTIALVGLVGGYFFNF